MSTINNNGNPHVEIGNVAGDYSGTLNFGSVVESETVPNRRSSVRGGRQSQGSSSMKDGNEVEDGILSIPVDVHFYLEKQGGDSENVRIGHRWDLALTVEKNSNGITQVLLKQEDTEDIAGIFDIDAHAKANYTTSKTMVRLRASGGLCGGKMHRRPVLAFFKPRQKEVRKSEKLTLIYGLLVEPIKNMMDSGHLRAVQTKKLLEMEERLSLMKDTDLMEEKQIVITATQKFIDKVGARKWASDSAAHAKNWVENNLGVHHVVERFLNMKHLTNNDFITGTKRIYSMVKADFQEQNKAHLINPGSGAKKMMYAAMILKACLIEEGYFPEVSSVPQSDDSDIEN